MSHAINPQVTPLVPLEDQPTIGLIGMGAMGKMYAKYLGEAGWKKWLLSNSSFLCHSYDLVEFMSVTYRRSMRNWKGYMNVLSFYLVWKALNNEFYYTDNPNVKVMADGHAVSRSSDFIVYSVEAEFIDGVVALYGPCKRNPYLQHLNEPDSLHSSSNKSGSHCSWPNVCQSTRKGCVWSSSSWRRLYRLVSFPTRTYCKPGGPTSGMCVLVALHKRNT